MEYTSQYQALYTGYKIVLLALIQEELPGLFYQNMLEALLA